MENSVYRLKLSFTQEPEIIRILDFLPSHSLEDLHYGILQSVNFEPGEMASFYPVTEDWIKLSEITLMSMGEGDEGNSCMDNTKIGDVLSQKEDGIAYSYDPLINWEFRVELEDILVPEPGVEYPVLRDELSQNDAPSYEEARKLFFEGMDDEMQEPEGKAEDEDEIGSMFSDLSGGYDDEEGY